MSALHFTSETFQSQVLEADKPVLVDFWATWCGPCRMVAPMVEQLSEEYAGRVVVGKVDVDEEPELAKAYRVFSIPTMILFKNGQIVDQTVGAAPKNALAAMLDKALL